MAWSPCRRQSRPQALHQLTGWALRQNTALAGLTVDQPSLEDVYLRLTGETGEAGPARPAENSERST